MDKDKKLDILLLIMLILVFLSIILTGCATLTQKDKDYMDKEFKHYKDYQQEPQFPEPRPYGG